MSQNLPYQVQVIIIRQAWGQILSLGEPVANTSLVCLKAYLLSLLNFSNNVGAKGTGRRLGKRLHLVLELDLPLSMCAV